MSEANENHVEKGALHQVVERREATDDNAGAEQEPPPLTARWLRIQECSLWTAFTLGIYIGMLRAMIVDTGKRVMKPKASRERAVNTQLSELAGNEQD